MSNIKLNEPEIKGEFMTLLKNRHSNRDFVPSREFTLQELSDIMWVAYGNNREKTKDPNVPCAYKTVGSACQLYPLEIYAFIKKGIYKYDPDKTELIFIKEGDFRGKIGHQEFIKNCSLNILIVRNKKIYEHPFFPQMKEILCETPKGLSVASCDCGLVLQNICLYCTEHKIKNLIRADCGDEKEVKDLLSLGDEYEIMFSITLGF